MHVKHNYKRSAAAVVDSGNACPHFAQTCVWSMTTPGVWNFIAAVLSVDQSHLYEVKLQMHSRAPTYLSALGP
jgi:hypothetical protein